jgi:hypothetical protein
MDYFLTQLRIISKIPHNGTISIINNNIEIYDGSFFSWINRKLNGDGKDSNVDFVGKFYIDLNIHIRKEIKIITTMEEKAKDEHYRTMIQTAELIIKSLVGLSHMKSRYSQYISVNGIIEHIEIDIVNNLLLHIKDNIDKKYHNEVFNNYFEK